MSLKHVIALDPGLTTGWAVWNHDVNVAAGEQEWQPMLELVEKWLDRVYQTDSKDNALVIAERFIITPETAKKTQAPWSLEMSGAVRFLCHRYGVEFTQQAPSEAKRLIHDNRLKALGWYRPGEGHANDALRHLAFGLARRSLLTLPATEGANT